MRVPTGSICGVISTAALRSKRITEPSGRRISRAVRTTTVDKPISAGHHQITVEYYENSGDAVISFSYALVQQNITNWRGEYYNNNSLSGSPAIVRDDAQVNFNWGGGSPAAGTIVTSNNTTLSWTTAVGASFYETCLDTVNNGICDTAWQTNAQATSRLLTNLTDGVYYWQVRATTANGNATADNGAWWTLTIDAPDPIREYIYAGGKLLASLTLTTGAPVLTYYHTDILGSVRAITSATGGPVTRHDYFPFGESTSPLPGDPRRFLGQELDAESGLAHFGARYYRNVWGRFVSVDPVVSGALAHPQKWNRYAYALNNPLRFVDPSGLDAEAGNEFPTEDGFEGRRRAGCAASTDCTTSPPSAGRRRRTSTSTPVSWACGW